MIDRQAIQQRWDGLRDALDERGRRLFAAAEVRAAGYGGLAIISEVTGLARSTINRGEDGLDAGPFPKERVRRGGGGRLALRDKDPALAGALRGLVEPATLGDLMRPLTWVSKSLHKLADELNAAGHPISHETVRSELVKLGWLGSCQCATERCILACVARLLIHLNPGGIDPQANKEIARHGRLGHRWPPRTWLAPPERMMRADGKRRLSSTIVVTRSPASLSVGCPPLHTDVGVDCATEQDDPSHGFCNGRRGMAVFQRLKCNRPKRRPASNRKKHCCGCECECSRPAKTKHQCQKSKQRRW